MSDAENRPASFHSIYERYARELHSYLYYLSGRRDLADDLTAETFLRVWASPVPVEMPTVKAYLFTIARRLYLTEAGKRNRWVELPENIAVPPASPDHGIQLERVMEALALLPELERSAVLLRAEHGLSYQEIAATLGIPAATVRVKVHRARLNLAAATGAGKRSNQ